jgi:hypothetical protein
MESLWITLCLCIGVVREGSECRCDKVSAFRDVLGENDFHKPGFFKAHHHHALAYSKGAKIRRRPKGAFTRRVPK